MRFTTRKYSARSNLESAEAKYFQKVLLFYVNVALLCSVLVKADLSKTEDVKEEKVSLNPKLSNSTSDPQEILQESPSEKVIFRNRSIFHESKDRSPVNKNYKTTKSKKDQDTKRAADLTGEANIYSPVLTFTESPLQNHWHIVPEIFPYTPQYRFPSPIPVIESQPFVNPPKLTYIQKHYKPVRNLEGRQVHSSAEHSGDYSDYSHHRYPEPENHPLPVHTETIHDFGRFLPEEYRSKIEKEAELIVKQKKTDNTTIATATTYRPQVYTTNTQPYTRENRQSARGYPHRHQKPVNTAFFHKGNFESAYPFPDDNENQNDGRHIPTSEGYPRKPTTNVKEPLTPIKIGEPYRHNAGVTSTEHYHRHYPYPPQQGLSHGSPTSVDSYHKNPHHNEHAPKDTYIEDIHQRDHYNTNGYHKNQQYETPNYRDRKPVVAPHGDPHKKGVQPHLNPPLAIPHDQGHHHRGSHSSTFRQQNQNQGYTRPNDPFTNDSHHKGPPNAPEQYGTSTREYAPAYPDSPPKPLSSHPDTAPYAPQQYSQTEHQNIPQQHYSGENKAPWSHSTELYQPVTAVPQKDTYSNHPHETYPPSSDSTKYKKNSGLHSDVANRPLAKSPLQTEPYYNSFRSLMDLYKSFGFQPVHPDEMPVLPPRYPFENPFLGKIEVTGPASDYKPAKDLIRPSTPPTYLANTNSPNDQHFNKYGNQYSNTNYDNKENGPSTIKYSEPYSNMKYNSGENLPSSVSYGGPHYDTKYNSGENGPSSVSYGGPHYDMKYHSGENGPSSVSNSGPYYDTKYHSGENGPSSVSNSGPYYDTKYNSGENGPSSVSYGAPHYDVKYNNKENYPDNSYFKHTSSNGNINSQHTQYVPYDANTPPVAPTEHYEPPETSQPHHALNVQIEPPKEAFKDDGYGFNPHSYSRPVTYSPPDDGNVKGIRIKDYDAETYFGNTPHTNLNSPPESELNSGAYPGNTSLYSHSVVRNNPYNIKSPYSGEIEEPYRPRQYRQKLKIEIDPSVEVSDERPDNFNSNQNTNKLSSSSTPHNPKDHNLDFSPEVRPYNPYNAHNEYQENEHGFTKSKEPTRSTNKNQQKKPKRKSKSHEDRDGNASNGHEYRHGKKKKNSSKRPYEEKFVDSQSEQDYPLPRHRKRSSHRSGRKHRSSDKPENMRAEGSTSHWGMERHKGLDGFFQYANVPGAKAFEYGYRMGGPEHTRERHHRTIGEQSKIKINWEDANGDSGDHYWEFNHNSKDGGEEEEEEKEIEPKSKPKSDESSEESTE